MIRQYILVRNRRFGDMTIPNSVVFNNTANS